MIVYNVPLAIEPSVEEEVIHWLRDIHIPEVMETGLFLSSAMFKVFEGPDQPHGSYAIQYRLENWDAFQSYSAHHAAALQAKTRDKFGERVLAFRTFLELQ